MVASERQGWRHESEAFTAYRDILDLMERGVLKKNPGGRRAELDRLCCHAISHALMSVFGYERI